MQQEAINKIAILYNKEDKHAASNKLAIDKFVEAANRKNINAEIISKKFINKLKFYNGLFIRDTTHPTNYTFDFSIRALDMDIRVVDKPNSILRCCNKIWQANQFVKYNICHPTTWLINHFNYERLAEVATYPCIIKIPDSCFSQGVFLAISKTRFKAIVNRLFKNLSRYSKSFLCQEFIKSDYDWRICIFRNEILFACKYHFVNGDWKIINHDEYGNFIEGSIEAVKISNAPKTVIDIAKKSMEILNYDDGLYGVDVKLCTEDNNAYVIEINDNPTIDAGFEDAIEGDIVYDKIMEYFC